MFKAILRWVFPMLLVLLAACSGNQPLDPGTTGPGAGGMSLLAAPELIAVSDAKSVSGAPQGIYVIWTREPSPSATGYYLYRYTEATRPPEPDPGDNPPLPIELRVNDGNQIPQPGSGDTVRFDDVFPAVVGETYYYRVTVVDNQDPPQESYPSNEMGWTVRGHSVTDMAPTECYWGDTVTFTGDTFGVVQNAEDYINFPIVGGETAQGTVTSWSDTEIVVIVPGLAVTGKPWVVVGATFAKPDVDLVILNPIITGIDPAVCFSEKILSIEGVNFGGEQGESTLAIGATDVSGAVLDWSDTLVRITVPVEISPGDVSLQVDGHPSNGVGFIPRPEILMITPASAQAGEPVVITGRHLLDSGGRALFNDTLELTVEAWAADEITFIAEGLAGLHLVKVESSGLHESNEWSFTVVESLAVSMGGLDTGVVYTLETAPAIEVIAPDDADRVELLVDDAVVAESTAAPFDDMVLPVAALTNGTHDVRLKAYRRAVTAESAGMPVIVYSLNADVNGDGVVDELDRDALELLLWMTSGSAGFLPWYDPDGDGTVTEADVSSVGYGWGGAVAQ